MKEAQYHINIFYSDEDSGFIADTPDLKNCSAFGATPKEALDEMLIAQKLWLEEACASGIPIPPPKYRPMIYQVS
jgi:predicted RNase H-like HicB family nuclease